MAELDVLDDIGVDLVGDDADVTHAAEDDQPEAHEGDEVAYDLGTDGDGGA